MISCNFPHRLIRNTLISPFSLCLLPTFACYRTRSSLRYGDVHNVASRYHQSARPSAQGRNDQGEGVLSPLIRHRGPMPVPRRDNKACATCGTTAGIFTCRGCAEHFCLLHTNEHRDKLELRMDELILHHNQFQERISESRGTQYQHRLFQLIDQWEQQSIEKIQQVANDTRQQLSIALRNRTDELRETSSSVMHVLIEARENGEFFEQDLQQWAEQLQQLQATQMENERIRIEQDSNPFAFISRISLRDDATDHFYLKIDPSFSNGDFEEYQHDSEKNEFWTGQSSIRFKIHQYDEHCSILFGITSTSALVDNAASILYGWAEKNLVYLGGKKVFRHQGYTSDYQTDDIVLLGIDCDRQEITLTNERTDRTYRLPVDVSKCPFPWQLTVRFFGNST